MKEKNLLPFSKTDPKIIFLSFFGVGFFPWAPGTAGSLAALPLLYLMGQFSPPIFLFFPLFLVSIIISCSICESVQKKYSLHDPSFIVIDEVLGMITTWFFLTDHHFFHYFLIFVLFRLFDIIKIYPASYFDRMEHGAGTILDDIVSGVFAGLSYLLCIFLLNYFSAS